MQGRVLRSVENTSVVECGEYGRVLWSVESTDECCGVWRVRTSVVECIAYFITAVFVVVFCIFFVQHIVL